MNIITKKVGKNKYAYLNYREGKKIVQKYLGRANSPEVQQLTSEIEETKNIPERFKTFFWDIDIKKTSPKQYKRFFIERLLELGDLDSIEWLLRVMPSQNIINVLLSTRTLSDKSKHFWLLWFGVESV